MFTKAEVVEFKQGADAISKMGPQTLAGILKFSRFLKLLRPDVAEIDDVRLSLMAKAEHVTHPATGQDVVKSPDAVNKELFDALKTAAEFTGEGLVFTKADLPKVPDFTGDVAKDERAQRVREELASAIALLGPFFDPDA